MSGKYTFELVGNTPENLQMVNDALFDIKESVFHNLYDAQKAIAGMERFDFAFDGSDDNNSFDDGLSVQRKRDWSITGTECTFLINKSIIKQSVRSSFRKSKFYKKTVSLDDISTNPDIFATSILVYINGMLYTGINVKPYESYTEVVFPFKYNDDNLFYRKTFKEMVLTDGAKLTILFVPNSSFMLNTKTLSGVGLHRYNNSLNYDIPAHAKTPICHITNYQVHDRFLKIPVLTAVNTDYSDNTKRISITYPDELNHKNHGSIKDGWTESASSHLVCTDVFLSNFLTQTICTNRFFEIPAQDLPVPIENMLVFKKESDGTMRFIHDQSIIKLYYPNFYEITSFSNNDTYVVYTYYSDDTEDLGSWYKDELRIYQEYVPGVVDRFNNGTIKEYIKNYDPVTMTYNIDDYRSSDMLHYRFDKLKEMINKDGESYKFYLERLIDYTPQFYIDVTDIDITTRLRTNNHNEIKKSYLHTTFNEDCYVFVIRADIQTEHLLIWVDGEYYIPRYMYGDDTYTYVYIPTRMINATDSIITVEKYDLDFHYIKNININYDFNFEDYVEISTESHKKIIPNDIYLTYIDDYTQMETYIPEDKYTLYYRCGSEYLPIGEGSFYPYDKVYLRLVDATYVGKSVSINITRSTFWTSNGSSNTIYLSRKVNNDASNFMLFKNGRLIPQRAIKIDFDDKVSGAHRFKVMIMRTADTDEFTLYHTPVKFYEVYYQPRIETHGFIDLTGKIDKPIDLRWHDIYINGLRIREKDMKIIGPYMVKIYNTKSLDNFAIYQRDMDPNNGIIDYITDDYTHSVVYKTEVIDILTRDKFTDKEKNILDDLILDWIGFFEKYLNGLLNPDEQQITNEMLSEFPLLFDQYNNLFINPETSKGLESNLYFQPDDNTMHIL